VLRAHQIEVFTQNFEHGFMRREGHFRRFAVQSKFDVGFLFSSSSHETKLAEEGCQVKAALTPQPAIDRQRAIPRLTAQGNKNKRRKKDRTAAFLRLRA
jgi:hypothetical protein